MNTFKKFSYRSYQFVMKYAAYFLGYHEPELISEIDGVKKIPSLLKENILQNTLYIT